MTSHHQQTPKPEPAASHRAEAGSQVDELNPTPVRIMAMSADVILRLQRTIGNTAVRRLLQTEQSTQVEEQAAQIPTKVHRPTTRADVEPAAHTTPVHHPIIRSTQPRIARAPATKAAGSMIDDVMAVVSDLLEGIGSELSSQLDPARVSRILDAQEKLRVVIKEQGPLAPAAQGLLDQINELTENSVRVKQAQLNRKLEEAHDLLRQTPDSLHSWKKLKRNRILEELDRIAGRHTPEGLRAAELRTEIKDLHSRVVELEKAKRESTNLYKAGNASVKQTAGKAETGAVKAETPITKAENAGVKTESVVVKAEQTATKAGGAGAKAGHTVAGSETTLAQKLGESAEIAGDSARARRAAKIGLLLDALLPGPLDVLELWIGFFGSLAEAKQKLKQEAYLMGFVKGLAASLLGFEADEAEKLLLYRTVSPGIGERVAGFEGVRERSTNKGVVEGWQFAIQMNAELRTAFRSDGFAAMAQKKKSIGQVSGKDVTFNADDILALALALKPRVQKLFEVAREQEEARRRWEAMKVESRRVRG